MLFLEILSCVVSILAGFVSLAKEYKEWTEKDPSASLPASDGSEDDCISNH